MPLVIEAPDELGGNCPVDVLLGAHWIADDEPDGGGVLTEASEQAITASKTNSFRFWIRIDKSNIPQRASEGLFGHFPLNLELIVISCVKMLCCRGF
jgi:hypothetical protein